MVSPFVLFTLYFFVIREGKAFIKLILINIDIVIIITYNVYNLHLLYNNNSNKGLKDNFVTSQNLLFHIFVLFNFLVWL